MEIKRLIDTWWKVVLVVLGGIFVSLMILGLIIGPPPTAKATSENAIKACRSSSYGPRDDLVW